MFRFWSVAEATQACVPRAGWLIRSAFARSLVLVLVFAKTAQN
jgi:hypothetical protein